MSTRKRASLEQTVHDLDLRTVKLETELPHIHKKLDETALNTKNMAKDVSEIKSTIDAWVNRGIGARATFFIGWSVVVALCGAGYFVVDYWDKIIRILK